MKPPDDSDVGLNREWLESSRGDAGRRLMEIQDRLYPFRDAVDIFVLAAEGVVRGHRTRRAGAGSLVALSSAAAGVSRTMLDVTEFVAAEIEKQNSTGGLGRQHSDRSPSKCDWSHQRLVRGKEERSAAIKASRPVS